MNLCLQKTFGPSNKLLLGCALIFCFISNGFAAPVKITLLAKDLLLTYPQEVRLSTLLNDAYSYTDHEIYSLRSALINPHKQSIVDKKKLAVLDQLKAINTPASSHIAKQLIQLDFVYREQVETDIHKVRAIPALDPMIKNDYWLLLPKRPEHILLISSHYDDSLSIPIKANLSLKDYIAELPDTNHRIYDNTWIIQANQDAYQAKDFQWKNVLYFLSPGAIVFSGLNDLPDQYRHLNADIAHLLTFYVEL
jgi:hypothetical protein